MSEKISVPMGKYKLTAEFIPDEVCAGARPFIVIGVEDDQENYLQDIAMFEEDEDGNIEFHLWRDCNDECYTDRGTIGILSE